VEEKEEQRKNRVPGGLASLEQKSDIKGGKKKISKTREGRKRVPKLSWKGSMAFGDAFCWGEILATGNLTNQEV